MLNFVICDDNLNILDRLEKMLENIFDRNDFEACIRLKSDSSEEIIKHISSNKVDVIMLDINLKSNQNGLDLAKEIRKINRDAYIIFTTGHLEYAMVAYKFKTFDYIAKPINYDRLEETIIRLFEDINQNSNRYIKIDNKNTLINEAEVLYIKRDSMKLLFHTSNTDYNTYSFVNKFKDKLPKNYVRCHKSYIVNVNQIKEVDPVCNTISFKNGDSCFIGPKYKSNLMEVLNNNGDF